MRLTFPTLISVMLLPALLAETALATEKTVYGLYEHVALPQLDLQVAAKLDTGAVTASLSARDITRFERDGQPWVRFYLAAKEAQDHPIERPVLRVSHIKRRAADRAACLPDARTERPVIRLQMCLGKTLHDIDVNLTDRSAFDYPLLIGSQALRSVDALIDPGLEYAAGKPACQATATLAE